MGLFKDLQVKTGFLFKRDKHGKQVAVESMREGMNHMGECCGVVCDKCGSLLRLPDQTNTHTHTFYFKGDVPYVSINGVEREITLEPLI